MKSNRFLTLFLSVATVLPITAYAQTADSSKSSGNTDNAATAQTQGKKRERAEKLAEELNLTPDQQAELKSIRENMKQQAQAIKSDSSLTPEQKRAKFKELRKSAHERMMAKLNPDQQKKFKELHEERKERREHRGRGRKGEGADQTKG